MYGVWFVPREELDAMFGDQLDKSQTVLAARQQGVGGRR
jgi:hypothetical protein